MDRLIGIDNRLKERLKFDKMVVDDIDFLEDNDPSLVEGIFFIKRYSLISLLCCRR